MTIAQAMEFVGAGGGILVELTIFSPERPRCIGVGQGASWCGVGTQLGTPRGRYDEHISKFPSVVKPRFIEPVGESQTSEGDTC
jgi:hypothetical protein